MNFEYFTLAVRNLLKRKKRAALTMLGIFIGITAVVALVSLGQGLQKTINDQFEKVGADKIIIQAKEVGANGGGQTAPGQLKKHEIDIIKNAHGVIAVAGLLTRAVQVDYNNLERTSLLLSIPEKQKEADLITQYLTLEATQGRLLTHKDTQKTVIGYNLAHNNLFNKNVRTGDKLQIKGITVEVVGVLRRIGDPGFDASVILPEADARTALADENTYSQIIAQSAPGENPDTVGDRVERTLRRDRHEKEGKEDFSVQTSTQLIESFNTIFNVVQFVFVGIAAISLIVGGIGIMNTMYTAVLERTREIGVMKAIGARNKDVLLIFLAESGLLGLSGGIIGVVLGAALSKAIEIGANTYVGPNTITAAYPLALIIGALLFATLVGAISGVLPARRASLLKPVQALRDE